MKYLLCFIVVLMAATALAATKPAAGVAERVVSLSPLITENIYLLGAQESLVAVTTYCVRPKEARHKEKIGSVMQVSMEKIVSLQPDLILATNLTQPQQVAKLRSLGLQVVRFGRPSSFADICAQFVELGGLLGRHAAAHALVEQARFRVRQIQAQVAHLEPVKVFLQVGAQPLFSAVPGSFTHDFIRLGGGINIAGQQKRGGVRFEQVIAENPAVIIVAIMGSESGIGAQEMQRWLAVDVLEAARNSRVHIVDPDVVCSPSPTTFADTLAVLARLIHPEITLLPDKEVQP